MKTLTTPADCQEILERLNALRENAAPRWGRMSPHQAVCHLYDSFMVCLGEKPVSPASGFFQRTVMKWGALYLPMQWPKNLPTRPEVDQTAGGTPPKDFEKDKFRLRESMERFAQADRWSTHPLFGPMKESEWMRWGYLHMDHHLRQFGC
jgi:hypothetical protein